MLKPFPAILKLDMYSNIEIEYAMLKSNTAKLELIALLMKLYTTIMKSITEVLKHNIMY